MPHFLGDFFQLGWRGSPLVSEHTSLPFPSSTVTVPRCLDVVVWQLAGRLMWESAQSHTPLGFPATCGICSLLPLLTHEGLFFKQPLPASAALLIYKTQSNPRIK